MTTDRRLDGVPAPGAKPAVLARVLCTLVPVFVLAAFGVLALRQDRRWVESEVRERGQLFAGEAVDRCWRSLFSEASPSPSTPASETGFVGELRVSAEGRLLLPSPMAAKAEGTFIEHARFSSEQAAAWGQYEWSRATNAPLADQAVLLENFQRLAPPPEFEALALFRLGLASRGSNPAAAADRFRTLLDRFPDARGDTGLSLWPLASLALLEISASSDAPQAAAWRALLNTTGSNALARPNTLTPVAAAQDFGPRTPTVRSGTNHGLLVGTMATGRRPFETSIGWRAAR